MSKLLCFGKYSSGDANPSNLSKGMRGGFRYRMS